MENYKIIRKNQFACSLMQIRRDKKIPVALLQDYDEDLIEKENQWLIELKELLLSKLAKI